MNTDPISLILAGYCVISGLHHVFNGKALQKYALHHGIVGANQSVKMSALILFTFAGMFLIPDFALYAGYGLSGFLVITAFSVHKFLYETDPSLRMSELLHFIKNLFFAGLIIAYFIGL